MDVAIGRLKLANNLDILLSKLHQVKQGTNGNYQAICPAHEDKRASLSIKQNGDKILLKCFAGCETSAIAKAIGVDMRDLFIDIKPIVIKPIQEKLVAEYNYTDENGKLLYQVCRFEPKTFKQRHRNGGGEWIWNMEGVSRVPYHLDAVMRCWDDPLYHVEGEKDADNLTGWGRVATTTPGGAQGWKVDYAKYYAGKKVVVIPDNDTAGYEYAKDVIRSIVGKARDVRVIILPKGIKDISDWLQAGNDVDLLHTMEQEIGVLLNPDKPSYNRDGDIITWHKMVKDRLLAFSAENVGEERTGIHARTTISCDYIPMAWGYFNIERSEDRKRISNQAYDQLKSSSKNADLTKEYTKDILNRDFDMFCAGLWEFQLSLFIPEMLHGDPAQKPIPFLLKPYLIEGGGTILYAPPGRGKSYSALLWAISVDAGCNKFWDVSQGKILFINLERSKESLSRRVAMVNCALGLPATRPILTLNARGKSLNGVLPICRKFVKEYGVQLVILDSISRAGYGDLNENQPMNKIIDALSSLSKSWMALSHTSRGNEEHAYGSIMLDAGADICVQLATEVKDDGTLGLGFQITKQNDIGYHDMDIYALEFGVFGLTGVRLAKSFEFSEIETKTTKKDPLRILMDYVLNNDNGKATASQASLDTGIERTNVTRMFKDSGKFTRLPQEGKEVFYGVKIIG